MSESPRSLQGLPPEALRDVRRFESGLHQVRWLAGMSYGSAGLLVGGLLVGSFPVVILGVLLLVGLGMLSRFSGASLRCPFCHAPQHPVRRGALWSPMNFCFTCGMPLSTRAPEPVEHVPEDLLRRFWSRQGEGRTVAAMLVGAGLILLALYKVLVEQGMRQTATVAMVGGLLFGGAGLVGFFRYRTRCPVCRHRIATLVGMTLRFCPRCGAPLRIRGMPPAFKSPGG